MKKGKKEIMTIEFSIEVEVKRAKKFSRELLVTTALLVLGGLWED